ncbi:MAG TPA: hypothetical protein PKA88_07760, partial [Polyangiaceae bacterium]|nr:hypothetical protein [Polyangiaceae bacterium]
PAAPLAPPETPPLPASASAPATPPLPTDPPVPLALPVDLLVQADGAAPKPLKAPRSTKADRGKQKGETRCLADITGQYDRELFANAPQRMPTVKMTTRCARR